jgi:hypothetical protein
VRNPLEVSTICQELMDRFGRTIVEIRPLPVWGVIKFSPYPVQLRQPDAMEETAGEEEREKVVELKKASNATLPKLPK